MDNPTLAVANALINLFFAINFSITAFQRKLISLYYVGGAYLAMSLSFSLILLFDYRTQNWSGPVFNLFFGLFFLFYFAGVRFYANLPNWPKRFWSYLAAVPSLQIPAVLFTRSYNYRVAAVSGICILIFMDFLRSTRLQQDRLKKVNALQFVSL